MKTAAKVLSVLVLFLVALPRSGESCMPDFPQVVFTRPTGPDGPGADFAKGRIGIPLPTWRRPYLVVAYRYLSGKPLSPTEQRSMLDFFGYDDERSREPSGNAIKRWLRERGKHRSGVTPKVSSYRHGDSPYYEYENCLPAAFETAADTLQLRAKQFGEKSSELQEWINGQDAVFNNCTDTPTVSSSSQTKPEVIPAALPDGANATLRADRAYQIAAAHFYRNEFAAAVGEFDAIAKDESSSWHVIAPYMAVRTIIRQSWAGTDSGSEETYNPTILAQAEPRVAAILGDAKLKSIHHDTERLQSLISFHLHPDQRQHEVARLLTSGHSGVDFGQQLMDYKLLLDGFLDVDPEFDTWPQWGSIYDQKVREWKAKRYLELKKERSDELSDWLITVQSVSEASKSHAVNRWKRTGSIPWLFVAMLKSSGEDQGVEYLLKAAGQVSADSPAYTAISFHRSRLLREFGDVQSASRVVDEILAKPASLPPSAVNLLKDEQMRNSATFDEFRERLVRTPVEGSIGLDAGGEGASYCDQDAACNLVVYGVAKPKANATPLPQFDLSAAETLNTRVPVDLLAEVVLSGKLPANLQKKLAPAVWARAVLLGNQKAATRVVDATVAARPEMKPYVDMYAAAKDNDERHFVAIFTMTHFPGLRPFVESAYPRTAGFAKIDDYRDNWWCGDVGGIPNVESFYKQDIDKEHELRQLEQRVEATGPFYLSQDQKSQAEAEWKQLRAIGWAEVYLPSETLEWARKHPGDARVPEALHFAWRAERYSCANYSERAPRNHLSRDIFTLLHKRYPGSEWTKKTRIWQ